MAPDWVLPEWTVDQLMFAHATTLTISALCEEVARLKKIQGLDYSGPASGVLATERAMELFETELSSRGIEIPGGA